VETNEAGTAVESGQESVGTETETGAGPDLSGVERLLGEFRGTLDQFGSRFDAIEQRIPEPAREEPAEEQLPTPSFSDADYDEHGELTMEAQTRAIQEIARDIAQQQVQAAVNPIIEAQAREADIAYADYLEETYPDLQDEETQDRMLAATEAFAEGIGRPELANNPRMLEVVYLAQRAADAADRETPAEAAREVSVERGSGAGPAPASSSSGDDAIADRIVGRAQRRQYRIR
jgi:hypothetical protein